MEQMKENYLNEIEKLNNRVSNLELIEAKYNRILTAMIEDSQSLMPTLVWKKRNQKTENGTYTEFRVRQNWVNF